MTPKQDRNGVPGPSGVNSSAAQPSPSTVVPFSTVQSTSESVGNARKTADTLIVPPSEPSSDWDAGMAVYEGGGERS